MPPTLRKPIIGKTSTTAVPGLRISTNRCPRMIELAAYVTA